MSIFINNYSYLRARSIPSLVRLCNNLNRKTGIAYKYNIQDGADGYFYAIYYGKVKTEIPKPDKEKSVEIDPKEIIDA